MDVREARRGRGAWWPAALLVGAVLVAFSPAIVAEFVTWDDRHNLFGNERMNPPSLEGVRWYWTHPYKDLYVPVTYTVWSALALIAETSTPDALGGRLNAYVFHLFNVLLHATSALAAYAVLKAIGETPADRPDWPAWAGAMLFALHPVQVESVAWASGMKDVLAGMLSLLAIWQYVAWARRTGGRFWVATICFIVAMLAKPSAVVVPLIAAILDALLLKRPWRTVARSAGAWLILAIPVVIVGKFAQPTRHFDFVPAWWQRPLVALDAVAFYVGKIVAPVQLGIDYGRSPAWLLDSWQQFITWTVPVGLLLAAIVLRRRMPAVLAGLLVLIVGVMPVLGLVPFDFQSYSTVADHYLYLAMLGPAIVSAAIVRGQIALGRTRVIYAIAVLIVIACGVKTFVQARTWSDSQALFKQATQVNPGSVAVNVNHGNFYFDLAAAEAQASLRAMDPMEKAQAEMTAQAHLLEAARLYRKALASHPNDATAHLNLGNTLFMLNLHEAAAGHYRRVLEVAPDHEVARRRLQTIERRGATTRGATGQ